MNRPRKTAARDKPDVGMAKANLERIKRQRPAVDRLVEELVREKKLNNFTASAVIVFRGGRP